MKFQNKNVFPYHIFKPELQKCRKLKWKNVFGKYQPKNSLKNGITGSNNQRSFITSILTNPNNYLGNFGIIQASGGAIMSKDEILHFRV